MRARRPDPGVGRREVAKQLRAVREVGGRFVLPIPSVSAVTLAGQTAVVTGSSRGVGAAVGQYLASRGMSVGLLSRSSDELADVAASLSGEGRIAHAVTCDVGDGHSVRDAFTEVNSVLGPVDVLVANAAVIAPIGPTVRADLDEWARALTVNVAGVMACVLAVLPGMLERGFGRIVAVSSGAAAGTGMPNGNAYSVSKAAVEMLVRNLAAELAGSGVAVNAVRPGRVDTAMQRGLRTAAPEDVGRALVERHQSWYRKGELLDPALPARLIGRLLETEASGEVVSVYDHRGRQLLAQAQP